MVAAIQMSCSFDLAEGCWPLGRLFSTLAVLCTQHRCCRVPGNALASAFQNPDVNPFAAIGGAWMLPITLQQVAKAHQAHPNASIVGTNGARDGADVVRFLLAGARAVAMTSAVITDGPAALRRALDELDEYCTAHDVAARELVGEAVRQVQTYEEVAIERRL